MKKILLITDNKAGHEALSKGVVEHLREHYEIEVQTVSARLRARFLKSLFPFLLNRKLSASIRLKCAQLLHKKLDLGTLPPCHLVVSAGGMTAFLNVILAQKLGAPNLYLSSLRGIDPANYTQVVSLLPSSHPNVIQVDLAPVFTRQNPERSRAFVEQQNLQGVPLWSLLIGGATSEYSYSAREVEEMLAQLTRLAQREGARILLTTSRRSGADLETVVEQWVSRYPELFPASVLFGRNPDKVAGLFMDLAQRILVTEDSGSMITEGILTQKPVFTLKGAVAKPEGVYRIFIEQNAERCYIRSLQMNSLESDGLSLDGFKPLQQMPFEPVFEKLKPLMEREL